MPLASRGNWYQFMKHCLYIILKTECESIVISEKFRAQHGAAALYRTVLWDRQASSSWALLYPLARDNNSCTCWVLTPLERQSLRTFTQISSHISQSVVCNLALIVCGLGEGLEYTIWEDQRRGFHLCSYGEAFLHAGWRLSYVALGENTHTLLSSPSPTAL